jgi:hypothetical protein
MEIVAVDYYVYPSPYYTYLPHIPSTWLPFHTDILAATAENLLQDTHS